jgi:hypothetical protein
MTNQNLLINNNYSPEIIDPWFVTGFTDGEGSFYFSITDSDTKIKWRVKIFYSLVAANNPANYAMLVNIRNFFGVGSVKVDKNNAIRYLATGLKDSLIIRDHFIKFPLMSSKIVHFQLWSKVIDLMLVKEHLKREGLLKIIGLKVHSPKGLSDKLLSEFPNFPRIECPNYSTDFNKMNANWLAGFMNADGHFGLHIQKNKSAKLGEQCQPVIKITQNNRSLKVLHEIAKFLNLGKVFPHSQTKDASNFKILSLTEINSFIDQFKESKLQGAKALDYYDFGQGVELMNKKEHLNPDGLEKIRIISQGMNTNRTTF